MTLRKKAFTLIEMLVVIAIIAILAAALFPAIQSAIDSAKATAMKQKGRGIWVAIVSANSEREPLSLNSLWPVSQYGTNSVTAKAQDYFNFLMSNGDSNFTGNAQNRVCGDLSPTTLSGSGVPSSTGTEGKKIASGYMAWHVALVSDTSSSEDAFLISKNINLKSGTGTVIDDSSSASPKVVTFATMTSFQGGGTPVPFGVTHGVWVTRGGGTFDARPKYLTLDKVNGPETNMVMQCDNANDGG